MTGWSIPPEWRGETAFIVAGGTSVRPEDVERLRGRRVVVVNSSYETAPFAQYLFFGDVRWWQVHRNRPAMRAFAGRKVTVSKAAAGPDLLKCRRVQPPPGFADTPDALASQRTSLQGAMNLVAHLGATRIVLLGADACRAADGRTHHHSAHQWQNKEGNKTWDIQMTQLRYVVKPLQDRGVVVLNASPISRLPWWPKVELSSVLEAMPCV